MRERFLATSVTRCSDLEGKPFQVNPWPRERWCMGDYMVVELTRISTQFGLELASGRMVFGVPGDLVIGVLGDRYATLEATGTWQEARPGEEICLLTGAGLFGKLTSVSAYLGPLYYGQYVGHVQRQGHSLNMADFVPKVEPRAFETPTVLLIGTSMSSGKTTTAMQVVRRLKRMGLKVLGAKLAGAARYRDTLKLYDAGADAIFDFCDAGLPSTVVSEKVYQPAMVNLLSRMAAVEADVAVIELGASPMEAYNGATAMAMLRDQLKVILLCASDPYAVVGLIQAYGNLRPDLVAGPTANTLAGSDLVKKMTGIDALDLTHGENRDRLEQLLRTKLALAPPLT